MLQNALDESTALQSESVAGVRAEVVLEEGALLPGPTLGQSGSALVGQRTPATEPYEDISHSQQVR
jgi:hypothetical protein